MTTQSFTASTESITHDSDPKLLEFVRVHNLADPDNRSAVNTVETGLGTEIDLGIINYPRVIPAVPPFTGPEIVNLTGGSAPYTDTVTFSDLVDGSLGFNVTPDGAAANFLVNITAADLKALAIAQGYGAATSATIDITSLVNLTDLTAAVAGQNFGAGVPIANMNFGVTAFDSSTDPIATMTVDLQIQNGISTYFSSVGTPIDALNTVTGSSTAPIAFVGYAYPDAVKLNVVITSVGTHDNFMGVTLTPPNPLMSQLNNGSVSISLHLDDATLIGPFVVTAADLAAIAPLAHVTTFNSNNPQTAWDLSGLVGRTIVSTVWTITGFDLSISAAIDKGLSLFSLTLAGVTIKPGGIDDYPVNPPIWDGGTTIGGVTPWVTGPLGGFVTEPTITIHMGLQAQPTNLSWPIDAPTIISSTGGPPMLFQQTAFVPRGNIPSFFAGYTISNFYGHFYGSYGPDTNIAPSIVRAVITMGSGVQLVSPDQAALGIASTPIGAWSVTTPVYTVSSNTNVYAYVDLFPRHAPAIPASSVDLIMTAPYEVRNRNNQLYRFIITPPPGWGNNDETTPRVGFKVYVSQGLLGTGLEEWTPFQNMSGSEQGTSYAPIGFNSALTFSHLNGLPMNYGGTWFTGWEWSLNSGVAHNYLRIILAPYRLNPTDPDPDPDLTGWKLKILANAREL